MKTRKSGLVVKRLGGFAGASAIWGRDLSIQVDIYSGDLIRLLELLGEYYAESKNDKATEAARVLARTFPLGSSKLKITLDVPIAGHGALLDPAIHTVAASGEYWETLGGKRLSPPEHMKRRKRLKETTKEKP